MTSTHWQAWHAPYADENSELSRRLRIVRQHIAAWLEARDLDPGSPEGGLCLSVESTGSRARL